MGDHLGQVELGFEPVVQQVVHLLDRGAMRVGPATEIEPGYPPPNERAQLAGVRYAARGPNCVVAAEHGQRLESMRSGPRRVHQAILD
jgi:hypothetical protein